MKKERDLFNFKIPTLIALVFFSFGFLVPKAQAEIHDALVTADNNTANVVSAYNVSFSEYTPVGAIGGITVQFDGNYTIDDGAYDISTAICANAPGEDCIADTEGMINIDG